MNSTIVVLLTMSAFALSPASTREFLSPFSRSRPPQSFREFCRSHPCPSGTPSFSLYKACLLLETTFCLCSLHEVGQLVITYFLAHSLSLLDRYESLPLSQTYRWNVTLFDALTNPLYTPFLLGCLIIL